MFQNIIRVLGGDPNKKELDRMAVTAEEINGLEGDFEKLSDEELKGKTAEFRQRLEEGEPLDDLLPEAFAAVREACKRTIGLRHYDVQMIGGITLHSGRIAEMRTGEGKTLVATLPLYLNALTGKGTHLVTVNDYLARRDARWMAPVYMALGMTVGVCRWHPAPRTAEWLSSSILKKYPRTKTSINCAWFRATKPTWRISPTAPTANSVSIICATTLPCS